MSTKPLTLALDISTHCGWALGRDGDERPVLCYGTFDLGRMANGLGRIASCLAGSIGDTITLYSPVQCIIEAPLPQQKHDTQQIARLLIGLALVAEMVCFEYGVTCTEEFPGNARKLVLGTANVKKDGIISWCRSQGWDPPDDNAADALLLLRYKHLLGRMRIMAGAGSVRASDYPCPKS